MKPKAIVGVTVLIALISAVALWLRFEHGPIHYTGFVEGEERVLRSEVTGRILEVRYAEGDPVPANDVIALLDDGDIRTRLEAKHRELEVLDSELRTQEERIALTESTWRGDVEALAAQVRRAAAAADLADKNLSRERELVETGASTAQLLDESRSRRDQAENALRQAQERLAQARAREREVTLAKRQLETLGRRLELARAELAELEMTRSKYAIRSPRVATVVQTQFAWPGELAQPGTAILAVLDPNDKYVQIYVPVPDLSAVRIGDRVEVELDSRPGFRFPGEISFVSDQASFTPEKIETRSDRVGQVYRVKIRIVEGAPWMKPGTEGNVYLVGRDGAKPERENPA